MIIFNKNKLLSSETDCIGVVGDNIAYTQEFYIKGISDDSINYTLHLRFPDGSVNSVIPDITSVDRESTMLRWIVKKNDIFMHGYFEVQIEGVNSTGLVFQTEIVKLYADESIPIEDREFENPNSETLKLREEAYEMVQKLDEASDLLDGTDLKSIENTGNKVTFFRSNFSDADNKKYPTIIALIDYLNEYYYNNSDIDDIMASMQIDDEGYLSVTLPYWNGEAGETLVIGKVSGKDGIDGVNGKDGVGIASTTVETSALDGGTNAITFNLTNGKATTFTVKNGSKGNQGERGPQGEKGETGATGPQGEKGEQGADGYSPVKGTDYWTDTDKDEIIGEVNETITQQLTDLTQVEPNFANSIDECTDTSKVYVLPDGYVYGYIYGESTSETETVVPIEWSKHIKLDKTTGAETSTTDRYHASQPFYVNDDSTYVVSTTNDYKSYGAACWYKEDGTYLGWNDVIVTGTSPGTAVTGNVTPIEGADYFRLRWLTLNGSESESLRDAQLGYVTVTKTSSASTKEYSWQNTGHAFIPANYEDRIIAVETKAEDHESRLLKIESLGIDNVPSYIKTEAERVANLVLDVLDENSLVIASCSDMHHYYSDSQAENGQAIEHCAMGIGEISKYLPIDLYINHGDYRADNLTTAKEINYIRYCLSSIYGLSDMQEMWLIGNHDIYNDEITDKRLSLLLRERNKHNKADDSGKTRAYGFKDFEEQKVRVIYLNTSDDTDLSTTTEYYVSPTQCEWLINTALDFSDKDNISEWGIVLMSHIPLDFGYHIGKILDIVNAYLEGSKGTIDIGNTGDTTTLSYDFSTGYKAKVICAIHGHTHNYISRVIGSHNILSIATPNVSVERYNNYAESNPTYGEFDTDGTAIEHTKTVNTAESTSFVIYVISRTTNKIYAIHFGAGVDREVEY